MKKALLLLSGGIDSPVAGFVTQEKFSLEALHFSQTPFTDSTPEEKALSACASLGLKKLMVVEAGKELQKIADTTYREYYFVLMKIFFMKVSEQIANKQKIDYLITGESLGQVSSQTLSNLQTIDSQVEIEILRPLLFFQKQEIIDISMKENLFAASCGKEMCDALASGKPKTKTNVYKVLNEMKKCEMDKLVKEAINNVRVVNV